MGAILETDPNFTESKYKERYNYKKTWNKSTMGWGNLSKVATAVQHLEELESLSKALEGQWNIQAKNEIANWAKEKLWNPWITSFKMAVAAVSSELAWAYKGTASPSEADKEEWNDLVGTELSPKQLQAYVDTAAWLLFGKINTEALGYYNVMWEEPQSIFTKWWYDFLDSKWLDVWYYFKEPTKGEDNTRHWWSDVWNDEVEEWGSISDIRG